MPWNDATDIVVAGTGEAYVATTGTTLPTTPTASLNAGFSGMGYHTEDGVTITVTPDVAEFRAWQSRQAIRREFNAQDVTIAFALMQWNETNIVEAFGGGAVTTVSGGYRYDFPEQGAALREVSLVVDCNDGSEVHRFVFPRVSATESVESQFHRSDAALLPITFEALPPTDGSAVGYYLTNSDAFATGS